MTNQQPITPPPGLVQQWSVLSPIQVSDETWAYELFIAHQAARWGADQELEACCEWLCKDSIPNTSNRLRFARRPKPPSLKEQALTALSHLLSGSAQTLDTTEAEYYIRRALEALPND